MNILGRNWYKLLFEELKKSKNLRIISPFVKEPIIRKIKECFDLSNFELITRFKVADFASNASSLDALKICLENRAVVIGIQNLHSKVYLFDKRTAIVTSANLTDGGLKHNYECGIFLKDKEAIEKLHQYFNELKNLGKNHLLTTALSEEIGKELNDLEIENSQTKILSDFGASLTSRDHSRSFVKFFGASYNRLPMSSLVRDEVRNSLCHYACNFSYMKRPLQFENGDTIYFGRMTEYPNDYAIFGKAKAVKFDEKRDKVSLEDEIERSFKRAYPWYLRVYDAQFIDSTLGNCPSFYELIKELDYNSFTSTRIRYKNGERSINPFNSLKQRPSIGITLDAADWIERRFQAAIEIFGRIDSSFIDSLPSSRANLGTID